MLETILQDVAMVIGFFHVAGPIAVRATFRFAAYCKPVQIALQDLPQEAVAHINPRIPQIENLGFELVGCYDCGELANNTKSFIAYFVNRRTSDFANVPVVVSPSKVAGYFEFSTRLTNGLAIETNTNRILPLTPANPGIRVFRFPEIQDAKTLYEVHRQLVEKHSGGFCAQGEPKGQEIQRLVRVVENYGPRHAEIGYMHLTEDGGKYLLTWKGAFLMTWRALWPTVLVRRILQRQAMRAELHSLRVLGTAMLQKA